jgi:dipeptidyl aminopeptidase/acylaminoacyl peptidase
MAIGVRRGRITLEKLCSLPAYYWPALSWQRDRLAFCGDRSGRMRLYVIDLGTREAHRISHGEVLPPGCAVGAWFCDADSTLLVSYGTSTTRQTLVAYDLSDDTWAPVIEPAYGSIDPGIFVQSEHITYRSFDGVNVPSLLYVPTQIADGELLPAVVQVHGGPTAQWYRWFNPFTQFLVDRGFVGLEPNIRGSTGYGVTRPCTRRARSTSGASCASRWVTRSRTAPCAPIAAR